jgi:DNA-binding IscR family transcriptional regulator
MKIADLIGHTRVTVTQHLSILRRAGLIETCRSPTGDLRLAPRLVEPGFAESMNDLLSNDGSVAGIAGIP